jgi:hypothetical protein
MDLILSASVRLAFVVVIGSAVALAQPRAHELARLNQQACVDAAKATLGQGAILLRCGELNGAGIQEAVVALGLKPISRRCTAVSELRILRHEAAGWKTAFQADRQFQIKNPAGFVGIDYIDESDAYRGFCVDITEHKAQERFSIALSFIVADGTVDEEGLPIAVAWNTKVGRYQEILSGGDPVLFAPEKKNVPHINIQERCCGPNPVTKRKP